MNNNAKFDPMTGEPIQNNNQMLSEQQIANQQVQPEIQINTQEHPNTNQITETPIIEPNNIDQAQIQNQLQSIPNVDQNKQVFIDNIQAMNSEKKEEKKEGSGIVPILILFAALLAIIYFLFPLLLNYI